MLIWNEVNHFQHNKKTPETSKNIVHSETQKEKSKYSSIEKKDGMMMLLDRVIDVLSTGNKIIVNAVKKFQVTRS